MELGRQMMSKIAAVAMIIIMQGIVCNYSGFVWIGVRLLLYQNYLFYSCKYFYLALIHYNIAIT